MSSELLPEYIDKIEELLVNELPLNELAREIESTSLAEHVAILLEAFPIKPRLSLWALLSSDYQQDVFLEMKNESRQMLLTTLGDEACFTLFDKLDANSLLELIEDLSYKVGGFAIYLGVMLFLNLYFFFRGKRKAKEEQSLSKNIITE